MYSCSFSIAWVTAVCLSDCITVTHIPHRRPLASLSLLFWGAPFT